MSVSVPGAGVAGTVTLVGISRGTGEPGIVTLGPLLSVFVFPV